MARQATPLQQMWQQLLSRSESGKLSRKNAVNILPNETVVLASLHFPLSNSYTCANVYVGSIMPSPIIVIQTGQNCPSKGIESIFGLAIPTVATYTLWWVRHYFTHLGVIWTRIGKIPKESHKNEYKRRSNCHNRPAEAVVHFSTSLKRSTTWQASPVSHPLALHAS